MSESYDSEETQDEVNEGGPLRKFAKEQEAKAREAEARAAAAERELAFAKAGLDLNDPKMTYFVKGYDGDNTPEAIKAAAEAAGFLAPTPTVPQAELAQHQQVANLSAGASAGDVWTGELHDNPQYQQEMRSARSPEEAMAVMARYGSPILSDFD